MRILVSNDDGITAPGLAALVASVRDLGEVTVAAPDSPQSAMAHSITLHDPLHVERVPLAGPAEGMEGFAVSGRPADCVRLAIRNLMDAPPDLVLSGINAGANVGVNIFYSGTVAAAAEGAMCGAPAVAFSSDLVGMGVETDYAAAAGYCRRVLDKLLADGLGRRQLTNVNIPILAAGMPKGVRVAEQSDADVVDRYQPEQMPTGVTRYHLATEYDFGEPHPDSDVALLAEGYITVTPLHVDITCHERLDALRCIEDSFADGEN